MLVTCPLERGAASPDVLGVAEQFQTSLRTVPKEFQTSLPVGLQANRSFQNPKELEVLHLKQGVPPLKELLAPELQLGLIKSCW